MEEKKKFILEFDEPPAFVYVCEEPRKEHVYMNGNKIHAWTSLELNTNIEEVPTYKIEGYPLKRKG